MKKILLVDSVLAFYDRNRSLLNRSEFQILTAITGNDALRVHRQERVDLIIAELNMPDLQGDEICTLIRTDKELKDVSVILVCGDTPENRVRVAQCGANAWLTKPINPEILLETIGRLLAVSTRKGYRVLLKAQVRGELEIAPFFCTSHNISTTGIKFETDKLLNQGDRITCRFFLPGACRITSDGEIVRSAKTPDGSFHYGVRFIDLAPEFQSEIERFIAKFPRIS
jgi:DNA-binding response OmpR family regulator